MAMEHILFENSYEITKSKMRRWRRHSWKRVTKHWFWFRVFMLALAGTGVAISLLAVACFGKQAFVAYALGFLFLFTALLVNPSVVAWREYRSLLRLFGETTLHRTIQFGETIVVTTNRSTLTNAYENIRFIEENDECFHLWIGSAMVTIVVYKDAFSIGEADAFSSFIKEKCTEHQELWSNRTLFRKILAKSLPRMIPPALAVLYLLISTWRAAFS